MRRLLGILSLTLVALGLPAILLAGSEFGPGGAGIADGTGTHFTVAVQGAAPVVVASSEAVTAIVEALPGGVVIRLQAGSGAGSTQLSVSGLSPLTRYYKSVDGLAGAAELSTDAAGSVSFSQDISAPHQVILKTAKSTLFLASVPWTDGAGIAHPEGFSDSAGTDMNHVPGVRDGVGTWDPATLTGTLVRNVSETIQIMHGSVTLDGNGFGIIGGGGYPQWWYGVYMIGVSSVKVVNTNFQGWGTGVNFDRSSGIVVRNNTFLNCGDGVYNYQGSGNLITQNTFQSVSRGVVISVFSWGNTVSENAVSGAGWFGIYSLGLTGANAIVDNTVNGCNGGIYLYNSSGNLYNGNTISSCGLGMMFDGSPPWWIPCYNRVYQNNFLGNTLQAQVMGVGNSFSQPLPDGGNHWSDWIAPDADGNGIVDVPYLLYDSAGTLAAQDDLPWTRPDGWILNRAPVFAAVPPQEVQEYHLLQFAVSATDPDGDAIVSLGAENLPPGAVFNPSTGTFSWTPSGSQAGVYTVTFLATDDGVPSPMTGRMDVVITVGAVDSPTEIADLLLKDVTTANLPAEVVNSYTANLKKVEDFILAGKALAAANQVEAFIQKTEMDILQGRVDAALGNWYIAMAQDLLAKLR